MSADNSSPSLHRRGLKFYFRAAPHDEMFSTAMFDFFDALKKKGQKIETLALFHEDTIFGTDSANAQTKLAAERGYKIVADIKYRANSPSLTAEVQQLKAANADVLMPSSYTTDAILLVKTMGELGYKPKTIVAQDAGFSEKALYDAVGDKIEGVISRGSFSLDLAAKRPMVGTINDMFKAKSGKDFNDLFVAAVHGPDRDGRRHQSRQVHRWRKNSRGAGRNRHARRRQRSCRGSASSSTRWARTTMPIRCCCNISAASSSPSPRRRRGRPKPSGR